MSERGLSINAVRDSVIAAADDVPWDERWRRATEGASWRELGDMHNDAFSDEVSARAALIDRLVAAGAQAGDLHGRFPMVHVGRPHPWCVVHVGDSMWLMHTAGAPDDFEGWIVERVDDSVPAAQRVQELGDVALVLTAGAAMHVLEEIQCELGPLVESLAALVSTKATA